MSRGAVKLPVKVYEALARYHSIGGMVVEAGFPGELRDVPAEGDDPQPPSVLQVAAWNEFGTKTAPPRPFMRQTMTRHRVVLRSSLAAAVYAHGNAGTPIEAVAARLGVMLRGSVQETITAGTFKDNAPLTKMIKGSKPRKTFLQAIGALAAGEPVPGGTRPLIDTGQMRQSVRWRARLGSREIGTAGGE